MADGTKDSMGRDLQAVALKIQEQENDPLVMNTKIRLGGGGMTYQQFYFGATYSFILEISG